MTTYTRAGVSTRNNETRFRFTNNAIRTTRLVGRRKRHHFGIDLEGL